MSGTILDAGDVVVSKTWNFLGHKNYYYIRKCLSRILLHFPSLHFFFTFAVESLSCKACEKQSNAHIKCEEWGCG